MNTFSNSNFDNFFKTFQLSEGSIFNVHIYDTAGQERFNSIINSYYKKAQAILLVYDITNRKSFEKIKNFYAAGIKDNCEKDIPVLLLGNKADKEDERQISYDEGNGLAIQENYEFGESSCRHNLNVAGAFETLIERWNRQNKEKNKALYRRNSQLLKMNTEINLDKKIGEFDFERKRSQSIYIQIGEKGNIKLKKDKKKKKKKECCNSK